MRHDPWTNWNHPLSLKENFYDKTSYTIMFGPDKCGEDYKLHLIFRHKHPKTGVFEEKHAKPPDVDLKEFFTDRKTHLYTLGTPFIHSVKSSRFHGDADGLCFQEKINVSTFKKFIFEER